MRFEADKITMPERYKRLRELVNCVQYKEFLHIFDEVITDPNCDSMCATDANNLSFLYYAVFHLEDPTCLKAVIEGFPIHQAIGFTAFVKDLCLDQLSKETLQTCFHKFHRHLTAIYSNMETDDGKRTTKLMVLITLLDVVHHGLRAHAAIPSIVLPHIVLNERKQAVFRILSAIVHWISLVSGVLHQCLPFDNHATFQLLVQNPFLLAEWLCLNG